MIHILGCSCCCHFNSICNTFKWNFSKHEFNLYNYHKIDGTRIRLKAKLKRGLCINAFISLSHSITPCMYRCHLCCFCCYGYSVATFAAIVIVVVFAYVIFFCISSSFSFYHKILTFIMSLGD